LRAKVFVTPRKGILDPQGRAVEGALKSLGFGTIGNVRVGRFITLDIDARSRAEAESAVRQICERLLANSNIEDFSFEVDAE
jgi:phosphoribosylformylglycinamidine synthase PurS subunit